MSRQVSDSNLSTRKARAKLTPRAKPYWRLIDHGRHIGYRRTARGGAWVARRYLGSGKYAELEWWNGTTGTSCNHSRIA